MEPDLRKLRRPVERASPSKAGLSSAKTKASPTSIVGKANPLTQVEEIALAVVHKAVVEGRAVVEAGVLMADAAAVVAEIVTAAVGEGTKSGEIYPDCHPDEVRDSLLFRSCKTFSKLTADPSLRSG